MDTRLSARKPWLALSLLGIEYALLGWYLAAHHIFWLVGTLIVGTTIAIARKRNPLLQSLSWLTRQPLLMGIGLSLAFSLLVTTLFLQPILSSLMVLPLITLLYALIEMQAAGLQQVNTFCWLIIITSLGLCFGEAVDLFVTPSMRY
jgi:hypothetical protein